MSLPAEMWRLILTFLEKSFLWPARGINRICRVLVEQNLAPLEVCVYERKVARALWNRGWRQVSLGAFAGTYRGEFPLHGLTLVARTPGALIEVPSWPVSKLTLRQLAVTKAPVYPQIIFDHCTQLPTIDGQNQESVVTFLGGRNVSATLENFSVLTVCVENNPDPLEDNEYMTCIIQNCQRVHIRRSGYRTSFIFQQLKQIFLAENPHIDEGLCCEELHCDELPIFCSFFRVQKIYCPRIEWKRLCRQTLQHVQTKRLTLWSVYGIFPQVREVVVTDEPGKVLSFAYHFPRAQLRFLKN